MCGSAYKTRNDQPIIIFILNPAQTARDESQDDSDDGEAKARDARPEEGRDAALIDVFLLVEDL